MYIVTIYNTTDMFGDERRIDDLCAALTYWTDAIGIVNNGGSVKSVKFETATFRMTWAAGQLTITGTPSKWAVALYKWCAGRTPTPSQMLNKCMKHV